MNNQQSANPRITEREITSYLQFNERASKWAWLSVGIPVVVFGTFLVIGSVMLGRLRKQTDIAHEELKKTEVQLGDKQKKLGEVKNQLNTLTVQVNNYVSTPLTRSSEPARAVSGFPTKVLINYAHNRTREEAVHAAEALRSHGFEVIDLEHKQAGEDTRETTVRFFQYDRRTVEVGKELVKLLKSAGIPVRTEFDNEFVGQPNAPPGGTYELWLGTDLNYRPK